MSGFICISVCYGGRLSAAQLGPALDAMVDNAWEPMRELAASTVGPPSWEPYDRARAHGILDRERLAVFLRSSAEAGAIEGQAWNNLSIDSSAVLYVPTSRADVLDASIRAQAARMLAGLPHGTTGSVFLDSTADLFHLPDAPQPFSSVPWLVALPPSSFPEETLARLRALPMASADDGILWLQLYRDPTAPTQQEVDLLRSALAG